MVVCITPGYYGGERKRAKSDRHIKQHWEQINHNQSSGAKRFGTGRSESPVFHDGHMAAVHIVLVTWELRSPVPFMSRTEFASQGVLSRKSGGNLMKG